MVRITDWEREKTDNSIYGILITIVAFGILIHIMVRYNLALEYPVLIPVFLGVVFAIFIGTSIGLIMGARKKEKGFGFTLFFLVMFFMIVMFIEAIIFIIIIIILIFIVDLYERKHVKSLKIYTVNRTSVTFYRLLFKTITRELKEHKIGSDGRAMFFI